MYLPKNNLRSLIILAICLLIPIQSYAMDKIIAVVNDELITQSDLTDYIQSTYAGLASQGYDKQELEKMMLDLELNGIERVIEDKLILSKANEIGIIINERLVDERVAEIKARYPDEQTFLDALTKNGVTLTDIRTKILDQLKIKYIVSNEVQSKIFVNPQEVTQYYNETIDKYQKKERVNLDSIYIAYQDDKETAKKKAEKALEEIKNGTDFEKTREQYSDASSIGIVERGQLMTKIENAIFGLEVNEVSSLIEVDSGIYIFKLISKLPPETATLEEVKDKIYHFLFNQKFEKNFTSWIKDLKKDAYIEIK